MGRIQCNLTFGESLLFLLGWFLLLLITCGVAAPFFILSFAKYVINRCEYVELGRQRIVRSNLHIIDDLLFLIVWTVLTFITFGIAGIFFIFALGKRIANSIEIS